MTFHELAEFVRRSDEMLDYDLEEAPILFQGRSDGTTTVDGVAIGHHQLVLYNHS